MVQSFAPGAGAVSQPSFDHVPTFSKDVAPILFRRCVNCHRDGEIAPMSLLSYRDARPWAKSIREQVLGRTMPPWLADPRYGHFQNDRSLTQADIDTIVGWVNAGARQGNPQDLPPVPQFSPGWAMGEPDAVLEMSQAFDIPADGVVDYQYFRIATDFLEDKWVQAIEVRPEDRARVHHVIVYSLEPGRSARSEPVRLRADQATTPPPAPNSPLTRIGPLGPLLAAIAAGTGPVSYPAGSAKRIGAGSVLTLQMHYTTNGTPGRDRTRIGFRFAKEPPEHEIRSLQLLNGTFVMPPGAPNYRVDAEATFTRDVHLWAVAPHSHLRGKSFEYRLTYPDGRSEIVLSIPKFDFNWQTEYLFQQPLAVPAGTRLDATAYYDNSQDNPWNPDPTSEVRWGDQTWEEMMFSNVGYSVDRRSRRAPSVDGRATR